jgi:hypothetical protein
LRCQQAGVPITNYGLTIAYSLGIFERALQPFPAALEFYRKAQAEMEPAFASEHPGLRREAKRHAACGPTKAPSPLRSAGAVQNLAAVAAVQEKGAEVK